MEEIKQSPPSASKAVAAPRIAAKKRIVFGDFEFYPSSKKLLFRSSKCHLDDKMLELLALLIELRPNTVSKDVLIEKLWPDSTVSDWSLARLVSDTRKLIEDDGKQQSIIKTVRGKGFAFVAETDEIIDAYPSNKSSDQSSPVIVERRSQPQPAKTLESKIVWLSSLIFLVLAVSLVFLNQTDNTPPSHLAATEIDHQAPDHQLAIMQQIQKNLRLTFTTHIAQQRRRDDLVDLLDIRFPESKRLGWEDKFHKHFEDLNKSEKFLFDQIRTMTEGSIYQGNKANFDLLDQHPEIYQKFDALPLLYNHLNIWLNKYNRLFKQREDMCVVYVGEEDGVPFPTQVDDMVDNWIQKTLTSGTQPSSSSTNSR